MGRFRGKQPFDPTITQKVKNALYEAGREDLVDALMQSGLKELEQENHEIKRRLTAYEQEKVNFQTATGVQRIVTAEMQKAALKAAGWAGSGILKWIGGAALLFAGWAASQLWKGIHGG